MKRKLKTLVVLMSQRCYLQYQYSHCHGEGICDISMTNVFEISFT